MSASRDPEEVLASIRRLVAREVSDAQAREAEERPEKTDIPLFSHRARAAARHILGPEEQVAANGVPVIQPPSSGSSTKDESASDPLRQPAAHHTPKARTSDLSEEELRDLIREVFREEVRTRMGPRINEIIRKIVRQELAQLFPDTGER